MLSDFRVLYSLFGIVLALTIAFLMAGENWAGSELAPTLGDPKIRVPIGALGVTLLATLLNNAIASEREWRRQAQDQRDVASVLLVEIFRQADRAKAVVEHLNRMSEHAEFVHETFAVFQPSASVVFPSVVSKLTSLPSQTSRCVIEFEDLLAEARRLVSELPTFAALIEGRSKPIEDWQRKNFVEIWRGSVRAAHSAIIGLRDVGGATGAKNAKAAAEAKLLSELLVIAS